MVFEWVGSELVKGVWFVNDNVGEVCCALARFGEKRRGFGPTHHELGGDHDFLGLPVFFRQEVDEIVFCSFFNYDSPVAVAC